jgi:nicotinamidase-related amidase
MNKMVNAAREKGIFIIHAPSSVVSFYDKTPQRKLAQAAPFSKSPSPLSVKERWGTNWCWPDPKFEGVLPIDDSDMGCSCKGEKCEIREAWTRQIKTIELVKGDALTDNGQETWNLLAERKIDNVILCGVHLNMCVLGRPFGIRQMVKLGKNVALMRDMTDTMYNPERPPGVDHFTGTDLVINHVEQHWCPSFTSADLVDGKPFRLKEDERKLLCVKLLHCFTHSFTNQIISLGIAIPMITLTGRRFFGRTKKPGGLDTVDIAFEFGVGLGSGLSFAN